MLVSFGNPNFTGFKSETTSGEVERQGEQRMTMLQGKAKKYQLNIGKGNCILSVDGETKSANPLKKGEDFLLCVRFRDGKYQIQSLLISGFNKKEKISTGQVLKYLRSLGFFFTSESFRAAIIKGLTDEKRFHFDGFKKKEATVNFNAAKDILIFNGDFVKSVSEDFVEKKYVKLVYLENEKKEKKIKVIFCHKEEEGYVYKLTCHPKFCQMLITCHSFVKEHKLALEGRYTIRLSEHKPEWIIDLNRQETLQAASTSQPSAPEIGA